MIQPTVQLTVERLVSAAVRIGGLAVLAALVAAGAAFCYRWYARDQVPDGVAILLGVAVVAVVLNTQSALQSAILGESELLTPTAAGFTIAAFVTSAVAADLGRRLGDAAGGQAVPVTALRDLDQVGQIVRSRGRTVTVEVPEKGGIEDIDGYDPVPDAEKADLAGTTFTFPRGLTVAELRERLVERLREDHGIGHVDIELAVDGTVEFLAVGTRAAGLGVTLGPGTAVVAVRADPPFAASPGDVVQVWTPGSPPEAPPTPPEPAAGEDGGGPDTTTGSAPTPGSVEGRSATGSDPRRVATGELRGTAGDVATIALDAEDARELDDRTRYRLVTVPGDASAEREFAALLRAADETMGSARVAADSPLVGVPIGALEFTVVAVTGSDGAGIEAIPPRSRTVAAGDVVYVVARPEEIRRFEAAAGDGSNGDGSASETGDSDD